MKALKGSTILVINSSEKESIKSALKVQLKRMRTDIATNQAQDLPINLIMSINSEISQIEKLIKELEKVGVSNV